MNEIQLHQIDLNLLVVFEVLMEERSVTRAAKKLGKTPSAVSHALGRLRDQVGDPLMVKVGGKMQPSPFAEALITDVRPILKKIARIVQPPEPFEPATSHRVFRIATPHLTPLTADVSERVHAEAPNVGLEWRSINSKDYQLVAEGELDLALGAIQKVPEGIVHEELPTLRRYTFARDGHPALERWDEAAWIFWPHVMVGISDAARQTVEERMAQMGVERRVGARIPEFSAIAPLLASTNMLANQVPIFMVDDIARYGLRILESPVALPDLTLRFVWSARLANEPGTRWLREIVMESFGRVVERAESIVREAGIIEPV